MTRQMAACEETQVACNHAARFIAPMQPPAPSISQPRCASTTRQHLPAGMQAHAQQSALPHGPVPTLADNGQHGLAAQLANAQSAQPHSFDAPMQLVDSDSDGHEASPTPMSLDGQQDASPVPVSLPPMHKQATTAAPGVQCQSAVAQQRSSQRAAARAAAQALLAECHNARSDSVGISAGNAEREAAAPSLDDMLADMHLADMHAAAEPAPPVHVKLTASAARVQLLMSVGTARCAAQVGLRQAGDIANVGGDDGNGVQGCADQHHADADDFKLAGRDIHGAWRDTFIVAADFSLVHVAGPRCAVLQAALAASTDSAHAFHGDLAACGGA